MNQVRRLLAIGGSWGGISATRAILPRLRLPDDTSVVLVLHRQPIRSELAPILARGGTLPVVEAEDKMALAAGTVHVAPPDYHLLVEPGWLSLSTEEPVKFSRPSIDVLFESAAQAFAERVVAVVLTGASDDGAAGALAVRRHGGTVIVQDPRTAEQGIMPRAAIEAGAAEQVAPLTELPEVIGTALAGVAVAEERP
ncbi:chemotaxis protein CheB [Egicoccus sp. AB-alg2]|uniref:chemotaxis protein CheB n=1 Tax=Egicoccus sp. AB-alg2 TaxID=3242693 RepID=UPI00359E2031